MTGGFERREYIVSPPGKIVSFTNKLTNQFEGFMRKVENINALLMDCVAETYAPKTSLTATIYNKDRLCCSSVKERASTTDTNPDQEATTQRGLVTEQNTTPWKRKLAPSH